MCDFIHLSTEFIYSNISLQYLNSEWKSKSTIARMHLHTTTDIFNYLLVGKQDSCQVSIICGATSADLSVAVSSSGPPDRWQQCHSQVQVRTVPHNLLMRGEMQFFGQFTRLAAWQLYVQSVPKKCDPCSTGHISHKIHQKLKKVVLQSWYASCSIFAESY